MSQRFDNVIWLVGKVSVRTCYWLRQVLLFQKSLKSYKNYYKHYDIIQILVFFIDNIFVEFD